MIMKFRQHQSLQKKVAKRKQTLKHNKVFSFLENGDAIHIVLKGIAKLSYLKNCARVVISKPGKTWA